MKKLCVVLLLVGMAAFGLALPASAQEGTAEVPSVSGLNPFTAETNFMSLPGYVRWQYFVANNVWISRAEAIALVSAQEAPTGE